MYPDWKDSCDANDVRRLERRCRAAEALLERTVDYTEGEIPTQEIERHLAAAKEMDE